MAILPKEFKYAPAVFAVGRNYQIFVPVCCETVMWVKVGESVYYDHFAGVLRSSYPIHRITVPMEELDREMKYTVCYRTIHERKPYFTNSDKVMEYESEFKPVTKFPIHVFHISDTHNQIDEPSSAGKFFGEELDLLILNGDIPDHSGSAENIYTTFEIASKVTFGKIPIVFAKGNHDNRGAFADRYEEYAPTDCGRTYYTFRLGGLWGMVLDCGEDKLDENPEYGGTICFRQYRQEETKFIKEVIERRNSEYLADGVKVRLIISHVPFTQRFSPPFNIEEDVYREWCRLLRESVKPNLMLCGHKHVNEIREVGSENDNFGQPCTVILPSSKPPQNSDVQYYGGALTIYQDRFNVKFVGADGKIAYDGNMDF